MLDFARVRAKEITFAELCAPLALADLAVLTNEMVDRMSALIADCTDDDVMFVPVDPAADDKYVVVAGEEHIAWTLGHVIVHATASAEEAAFAAAELARGVPPREGRTRYEVPWRSVTTIEQCRRRLGESRRMRLATLGVWPDEPHLDNTFTFRMDGKAYNPIARFVLGLMHDAGHLDQIAEITRQARAARAELAAG